MNWGIIADWIVAVCTIILAAVAIFQETIRGWFYRPEFRVTTKTEPPDCVAVPVTNEKGVFVADSVYLRVFIENVGNATARNVEVYADKLYRRRQDSTWEWIRPFPVMNLRWANVGGIYFPLIAPRMGKYCDVGHIVDPARRALLHEDVPRLSLSDQQTSLAFDLMVAPNHRWHIIGPGEYRLDIYVAADNAHPTKRTLSISLRGVWDADETKMLRDGIGIAVL
jgi:hypothetical protein